MEDILANANIKKDVPVEESIAQALAAAKLGKSGYKMPDSTQIAAMEKQFVPGIREEYEKYFDSLIDAAKAQYGPNDISVAEYVAMKAIWKNWSSQAKNLSINNVDLSKSGGKTTQDLINQRKAVEQFLTDQASKIKNETAKHIAASKELTKANTLLYGAKGTAETPAKGSLAQKYNAYKEQLSDPNKIRAAKRALYGDESRDENNPAAGSIAYMYNQELAKQKPVATNVAAMTPLDDIISNSISSYVNKTFPSYSNFLSGVPEPKAGEAPVDPTTTKVAQYLAEYKKTGAMPGDIDSALIGQTQKAIDEYEQGKLKVSQETAKKLADQNAASIGKTRGDITSYNVLLDEARKKAPVVAPSTSTLLNQLQTNKTALGTAPAGTAPPITPAVGAPPTAPKFTPPPKIGLNLSNDFNTRMIQQDLAAQQQLQNPGTYAPGQFDPFFSGFLNSASQFSTQPSTMNSDGTFTGSALYRPNSGIGFGFQNAYDAGLPTGAAAVTGAAAGGYMDAQSVGQNNQALQNNQLGLASIPNMSQYANYTNNPGMTSPTQNTDDGGVGGVSVLGQTNPVW
jgi:hypothetical protein